MSSLPANAHFVASVSSLHPSVVALVSSRAASAPQTIAATQGDDSLTYGELNRRSDHLAHTLRSSGVGPETVVGLFVNRSISMLVGALGVLKAGGAYLPLDPAWPQVRVKDVLEDAQVPIVVTNQRLTERLPESRQQCIILDRKGEFGAPQPANRSAVFLGTEQKPDTLAYVIYTSGSTGKPKGVEILNSSLSNLVAWHREAFSISESDRATLLASPGFDASVWEVWPYLTAGASLHIPDNDTPNDPERLRDWLIVNEITIAFVPPAVAERLMRMRWSAKSCLRVLLTGADTLRSYPPESLPFMVVNNYGPTECAVVTTSGSVPANSAPDMLPSIGTPITNAEVYILDEQMRPVVPGTQGDLYIGGMGLARGYRKRPDLTAKAFVANPFGKSGSRLYKTGDKATILPDGQIAFLGRSDDQVKIRGYRIELDEIVTAINRHPSVDTSIAVAWEDAPGEKRLIAYVVPQQGQEITEDELREFLLVNIPDYMIPTNFYRLQALPMTSSGKVDRKSLPAPMDATSLGATEYVAPRTPIETKLTSLLASRLHMDKVGVNDNFFLVGGNSLLGAQVIARVRDAFGIELSLFALFNHPTVRELAIEIEQLLLAKLNAMNEDEAQRIVEQGFQASSM
jgi:amino acid adenylation domain-containing protein